jgi:phosphoenolpyruvate synthase/pyruvate phosphate dikinase
MKWKQEENNKKAINKGIKKQLIRGLGASPAVSNGRLKVALKADEINKVSALNYNVGGRTSQASIIAREYGVLCIISEKATKRSKSCIRVIVDGSEGAIFVFNSSS